MISTSSMTRSIASQSVPTVASQIHHQ
ncbi:hypothetical protein J2S58_001343 [Nakamurella flavida]|nr:hypothetical protein [Nakamurella flavida]